MQDALNTVETSGAGLVARNEHAEKGNIVGIYHVECRDADGNLKWEDDIHNLVVNVGKNLMLNNVLDASATSSTNVYMGLVNGGSTPTYDATDTMASHTGWTELNITSSSGVRKSVAFNAAATGSKATTSAVSWSVTSSGTVAGCFIVVGSAATTTNGNTSGTLFSAGSFSGGNRAVINGDTLNVSYTASV